MIVFLLRAHLLEEVRIYVVVAMITATAENNSWRRAEVVTVA
jgi:hypothetical protein